MFFKINSSKTENIPVPDEPVTVCDAIAVTDKGPLRADNEDTYKLIRFPPHDGILLAMVADGMGGHNAGGTASKMACAVVAEQLQRTLPGEGPGYAQRIGAAMSSAHEAIKKAGVKNAQQQGMGCTFTCAVVINGMLYLGHVGDSRLYQLTDGQLKQLTEDHTIVNELFKKGTITMQEKEEHAMKNVLVQALGSNMKLVPQLLKTGVPVQPGDRFLLCSDGVYTTLSHPELQALMEVPDAGFALECLSALAYKRKATDNFTAVLLHFKRLPAKAITDTKELTAWV